MTSGIWLVSVRLNPPSNEFELHGRIVEALGTIGIRSSISSVKTEDPQARDLRRNFCRNPDRGSPVSAVVDKTFVPRW